MRGHTPGSEARGENTLGLGPWRPGEPVDAIGGAFEQSVPHPGCRCRLGYTSPGEIGTGDQTVSDLSDFGELPRFESHFSL